MFLWVYSFQIDFSDKCTSYRLFHGVILPIEGIASFFGASCISGDSEKDSIGLCRVGEKPQKGARTSVAWSADTFYRLGLQSYSSPVNYSRF